MAIAKYMKNKATQIISRLPQEREANAVDFARFPNVSKIYCIYVTLPIFVVTND